MLLSGSKGLMMFESIQSDFTSQPDWNGSVQSLLLSYVAVVHILRCFQRAAWHAPRVLSSRACDSVANPTVREVVRSGDIGGFAFQSSDVGDPIASISSLTEVIRNHEWIMIVVVNTDACTSSGVSLRRCVCRRSSPLTRRGCR